MQDISYRASLKNLAVEELVDLAVHRPLGYVLARAALPTAISPDALTIVSMLIGILSGAAVFATIYTGHSYDVMAGLLLILSAVVDCSDGQLARMRRSTSRFGRMLDGSVDAVVQAAVVPASGALMVIRDGGLRSPYALTWLVAGLAAIVVGVRHTTLYDHFKNVYVRNTEPTPRDCDDAEDVEAEWARTRARGEASMLARFSFVMYRMHLQLVAQTMRWIDPNIPPRFRDMPAYSPERAERYRALNANLMRAWSFFGIGTHIFVFAVCTMLRRPHWYVVIRLGAFGALLLALVPLQRRASRAFFGATP